MMDNTKTTFEQVKAYYGKILSGKKDLQTSACCSGEDLPAQHREILGLLDDEILNKFYGCGSPIPPALEGATVLDLGCGSGRDAYLLAKLVGERGRVIGVDMTEEQLAVACRHIATQTQKFGFAKPNVDFRQGYIESLRALDIADNAIDVVVSNCVINLSPDKNAVFAEIFRVLKPGGELYFSDVFATRRVPAHLQTDPILYGECLAGALYIEDFRRLLRTHGCLDYRVVSQRLLTLDNPKIAARIGMIDFYSMTIRAFKLTTLEDICEDYGQVATYLGTIPEAPHRFMLDDHHVFHAHKPKLVCGNTASMLAETRFAKHFRIGGDRSIHFGPFACEPAGTPAATAQTSGGCC